MPEQEQPYRIVLTTAGSDEQAETLARALVDRRLAACVNLVNNVCSVYRWEGKTVREQEVLLVVKTIAERVEQVRTTILEVHSYEVPEVVVLPIVDGDANYLRWIGASVAGD